MGKLDLLNGGISGRAKRWVSLVLAYTLLLQAVFISFATTQHTLAAGAPDFAFVICSSHPDGAAPAKAPAKQLPRYAHCPICLTAASAMGVLATPVLAADDFVSKTIEVPLAALSADLPQPLSPKRSQGPPLLTA